VSNFFGFPKSRKAGFGSPDIPSGGIPLDTTDEDVVLEGVIVDFGEAEPKANLGDFEPGLLDPFKFVSDQGIDGEDMNAFLRRMMVMGANSPSLFPQDGTNGTILVDTDVADDMVKKSMNEPDEVPEPAVENAESVEDMLNVMGNENEKLENFIADAMKNIKHQA
jgi:hypothetical protein